MPLKVSLPLYSLWLYAFFARKEKWPPHLSPLQKTWHTNSPLVRFIAKSYVLSSYLKSVLTKKTHNLMMAPSERWITRYFHWKSLESNQTSCFEYFFARSFDIGSKLYSIKAAVRWFGCNFVFDQTNYLLLLLLLLLSGEPALTSTWFMVAQIPSSQFIMSRW